MEQYTEELLRLVFKPQKKGAVYYRLFIRDEKCLILPEKEMRRGLNLYHPSSFAGRAFKRIIPYLKQITASNHFFCLEQMTLQLDEAFQKSISSTGCSDTCISASIGDVSILDNRKMVVQIYDKEKIYAYGKYTVNETVFRRFQTESENLEYLSGLGIEGIPRVLYCGRFCTDGMAFLQTTERTGDEKNVYSLDNRHLSFLKEVHAKTECALNVEESDYRQIIETFESELEKTDWKNKHVWSSCLCLIKELCRRQKLNCSFFHGDFTPWNICCKQDHIFVFDFEYAKRKFPIWADAFHFYTQSMILKRKWRPERIILEYEKNRLFWENLLDNPDFYYLLYLFYQTWFYIVRTDGKLSENDRSVKTWTKLAEYIKEKIVWRYENEDKL